MIKTKKVRDTSGLVKKTNYNAKITEIECKIPSISGLATNAALPAVEKKIPNIISLVEKIDYNAKINEIKKQVTCRNHDQYITTPEFNKFTAEVFASRLAQANLVTKSDFDNKLISLNRKINSNKMRHLLDCNCTRTHNHLVHKRTLVVECSLGLNLNLNLNFRFRACFSK